MDRLLGADVIGCSGGHGSTGEVDCHAPPPPTSCVLWDRQLTNTGLNYLTEHCVTGESHNLCDGEESNLVRSQTSCW